MKTSIRSHRDGLCRLRPPDLSGERGVALVIVLLIVAILVSLVTHFTYGARVELALAGQTLDLMNADHLLLSGYQLGVQVLQRDSNEYDASTELWGRTDLLAAGVSMLSETGTVLGEITDEDAKINLNMLVDDLGKIQEYEEEQLRRLFDILELDQAPVETLFDWLDGDDLVRPGGAESLYYNREKPPYACANGPLETLNQLRLVKGWTHELLFGTDQKKGLMPFLTLHNDGRININTASAEVLRSLDDAIDGALALEIVSFRESEPFKTKRDLKNVPGMTDQLYARILSRITVQSNHFSIRIRAGQGTANVNLSAVVKRSGGLVAPVYWRLGS
ncbi:MAG: type II secretion system minor pseudopilin GspK [Deltaproteobacteria bacterium]|nr:type II secretion system minor pseudopilin GspK [Deltaproteobacteria bacterium]